jgi:hypothetical protein
MRTHHLITLITAVVGLAVLTAGCKKKGGEPSRPAKSKVHKPVRGAPPPGDLPADKSYLSGKVQAAVMDVQTEVDIEGMEPEGKITDDVKQAQADSVLKQRLVVSDDRGKAVFTTENFYIPKDTELRYLQTQRKYVLCDPAKKIYWAMTGSEIGNLLEGGPAMTRSGYSMTITDTQDKETIAGVEAVRSNAELKFNWSVKTKSGPKKGRVRVKLAIWHSADEKLKPSWGRMMVDFLTVPFQDAQGQKMVSQLKKRVKFPVKWSMEVVNEDKAKEKAAAYPKLVTVAQTLEVKEVDRDGLACPPAGYRPAAGPYEFDEGGQMISEELLSQIPPKPGKPPKDDVPKE